MVAQAARPGESEGVPEPESLRPSGQKEITRLYQVPAMVSFVRLPFLHKSHSDMVDTRL